MNDMRIKLTVLFLAAAAFLSCRDKPAPSATVIDGFAQGSTYHIVIVDSVKQQIVDDIDSILGRIDFSLSVYNPQSLISRINRNETDSVDQYIADCIRIAEGLSRASGGLYDITIKPLTAAYGFAGADSVRNPDVDSLLRLVGYQKIEIRDGRLIKQHPGVQIDLNSIAQGYTVDVIAGHFDRLGLENYLVEVGGEIFSRGANPNGEVWVVGIDKPVDGNYIPGADVQVKLRLTGKGLATSGNYRKYYTDDSGRKIVHTVNPLTGEPVVSNLLSATVVAPDATLADIYGTYFMVAGLEEAKTFLAGRKELEAYLVYSDDQGNFQVYATPGLDIKE